MEPLDEPEFEALVVEVLDTLPEPLAAALDNVAIVLRDGTPGGSLLGRYTGVPLTERSNYGEYHASPDEVALYRLTLCSVAADLDELRHEVRVTVIHELAHHFGIDDDRLHELGWA